MLKWFLNYYIKRIDHIYKYEYYALESLITFSFLGLCIYSFFRWGYSYISTDFTAINMAFFGIILPIQSLYIIRKEILFIFLRRNIFNSFDYFFNCLRKDKFFLKKFKDSSSRFDEYTKNKIKKRDPEDIIMSTKVDQYLNPDSRGNSYFYLEEDEVILDKEIDKFSLKILGRRHNGFIEYVKKLKKNNRPYVINHFIRACNFISKLNLAFDQKFQLLKYFKNCMIIGNVSKCTELFKNTSYRNLDFIFSSGLVTLELDKYKIENPPNFKNLNEVDEFLSNCERTGLQLDFYNESLKLDGLTYKDYKINNLIDKTEFVDWGYQLNHCLKDSDCYHSLMLNKKRVVLGVMKDDQYLFNVCISDQGVLECKGNKNKEFSYLWNFLIKKISQENKEVDRLKHFFYSVCPNEMI